MVHWFTCCALRQLIMNEDWLHSRKKILGGDTAVRAPVGSTVVILRRLARKASLRRIIARIPTCLSMPVIEKARTRQEAREAEESEEARQGQEGSQDEGQGKPGKARRATRAKREDAKEEGRPGRKKPERAKKGAKEAAIMKQ